MSCDALIAAGWMGSSSPIRDAVTRLHKMDESGSDAGMGFVVEVLDLWIKAEAPVHGWKTGGKKCADLIVRPTLLWWTGKGERELKVDDKYLRPALALIEKLDSVAWAMYGDIRSIISLQGKP